MKITNEQLLKKITLVVNKLMNLEPPDYDKKLSESEQLAAGLYKRDFGIHEWDWPQGVGLYGLLKLNKYYGDDRYDSFFQNWYDSNIIKGLPTKNINTTAPFLPLLNLLGTLGKSRYEEMCIEHAEWLLNVLPKTKEGGFQHVTSALQGKDGVLLNENQLWIDTLFMAVLFLNQMGQIYQNESCINEAIYQIMIHIKYLYDKQTGLFYHGWSFNENSNFGGVFWCRGNSWFTYGIMDYLDSVNQNLNSGIKDFIVNTYKAQVDALIKLQAPSGLWRTVLDDESSYEEVSGSAAIAAGILKGIKNGVLNSSYQQYAYAAVTAICDNIDEDGTVLKVSAGTGIGYNSDHYKNIVIAPMAYGQSLALICLCEALE